MLGQPYAATMLWGTIQGQGLHRGAGLHTGAGQRSGADLCGKDAAGHVACCILQVRKVQQLGTCGTPSWLWLNACLHSNTQYAAQEHHSNQEMYVERVSVEGFVEKV